MKKVIMKSAISTALIILLSFIFLPLNGLTQNNLNEKELKEAAAEIIKSSGTCALISLDNEGQPRARAMDPFTPAEDFTIWLGTNAKSRKVNQIKNDPRVTVYYLADDASGYVSIYGLAELIDDKKTKEKYWKPEWEAFYPNKQSDYLLIKVTPLWLEIISESNGINGDYETWAPSVVKF